MGRAPHLQETLTPPSMGLEGHFSRPATAPGYLQHVAAKQGHRILNFWAQSSQRSRGDLMSSVRVPLRLWSGSQARHSIGRRPTEQYDTNQWYEIEMSVNINDEQSLASHDEAICSDWFLR